MVNCMKDCDKLTLNVTKSTNKLFEELKKRYDFKSDAELLSAMMHTAGSGLREFRKFLEGFERKRDEVKVVRTITCIDRDFFIELAEEFDCLDKKSFLFEALVNYYKEKSEF